jgi:hypothetical protein
METWEGMKKKKSFAPAYTLFLTGTSYQTRNHQGAMWHWEGTETKARRI